MIRANSTLANARYGSVFPQGKQTDSPNFFGAETFEEGIGGRLGRSDPRIPGVKAPRHPCSALNQMPIFPRRGSRQGGQKPPKGGFNAWGYGGREDPIVVQPGHHSWTLRKSCNWSEPVLPQIGQPSKRLPRLLRRGR